MDNNKTVQEFMLVKEAAKHPIQQKMYRNEKLAKNNDVISNHLSFNVSNLFSTVQKNEVVNFNLDNNNNIDVHDLQQKKAEQMHFEAPRQYNNCNIAYSGFKLSADLDQIVFFTLLSKREMNLKTSVLDISKMVFGDEKGKTTSSKKRVINSVIRLAYTNLTIQYKDLSLEDFRIFRFKIDSGNIEINFDESFRKLMEDATSSQTYISIKTINSFKTSYAKCLYPLIKTRISISGEQDTEISLEEIVNKLKADGKNYKKTREKINIALKEIQKKCDIYKSYSYNKNGFTFNKYK